MSIAFSALKFLLLVNSMELAQQYCYHMKMLSYRTTDTEKYYLKMHMFENGTFASITRVLEDVPIPMWNIVLVQHTTERKGLKTTEATKILYNATYKTCEFWRYVKRIRVFNNVAQLLFKQNGGNMSLSCPLLVGTYVFNNIHVPPDTGMLKFMYWPNTKYTLFGTVLSQLIDKSFEVKCTYEINATILKTC